MFRNNGLSSNLFLVPKGVFTEIVMNLDEKDIAALEATSATLYRSLHNAISSQYRIRTLSQFNRISDFNNLMSSQLTLKMLDVFIDEATRRSPIKCSAIITMLYGALFFITSITMLIKTFTDEDPLYLLKGIPTRCDAKNSSCHAVYTPNLLWSRYYQEPCLLPSNSSHFSVECKTSIIDVCQRGCNLIAQGAEVDTYIPWVSTSALALLFLLALISYRQGMAESERRMNAFIPALRALTEHCTKTNLFVANEEKLFKVFKYQKIYGHVQDSEEVKNLVQIAKKVRLLGLTFFQEKVENEKAENTPLLDRTHKDIRINVSI